jgi:hypothetical protein
MRVTQHLHPPINFMVQPTNHSPLSFEVQTKKSSRWFWGPNHQIIAAGFEAQTEKPITTSFEAKPGETINLGFEAKPWDPHSLSPCVRCRLHTISPDLSTVRPLSTRPVLYHPRSSVIDLVLLPQSSLLPAMSLLSPAHHKTSKHISPHKIYSR